MCKWGTDKLIHVIRRNNPDVPDGWHPVYVDACIADYVQEMNDRGIITVGCCCGHGKGPAWVQVAQESIPLLNKHKYAWRWYADRTDSVMHDMPRQPGMLPYPDIQVAIVPGLDVRDIEIFQAAEKALDAVFAPLGFERSESTKDGRYVRIVYKLAHIDAQAAEIAALRRHTSAAALDLENAILWLIQYMHIHDSDMLHRMFEWAVREGYAVNTSRETKGALRVMLQIARDECYLFPDEWARLQDLHGPYDPDTENS